MAGHDWVVKDHDFVARVDVGELDRLPLRQVRKLVQIAARSGEGDGLAKIIELLDEVLFEEQQTLDALRAKDARPALIRYHVDILTRLQKIRKIKEIRDYEQEDRPA